MSTASCSSVVEHPHRRRHSSPCALSAASLPLRSARPSTSHQSFICGAIAGRSTHRRRPRHDDRSKGSIVSTADDTCARAAKLNATLSEAAYSVATAHNIHVPGLGLLSMKYQKRFRPSSKMIRTCKHVDWRPNHGKRPHGIAEVSSGHFATVPR